MAKTVKGINLKLGVTDDFQKEINSINKDLKNTGRNLTEINKLTRFDPKNLSAFNEKQKELNKIIGTTERQLEANNKRLKTAEKLLKIGKIGQDEFDQVKRAVIRSESNLKKFKNQLEVTKKEITTLKTEKFDNMSNSLKDLAGKFDKVALAAGAALGAIVKIDTDADTSFRKVSTLFGDVEVDMDNLENQMIDLSKETGIAVTELNEGLYQALSAGVPITEDAAEAVEFLKTSTELARAGFTSTESAVDTLTSIINAYGMEASDASKLADVLLATQNKGKTTVDELSGALSNVIPISASLGVGFNDVAASLATLTAQGVPTNKAATQLKSLLVEVSKSGTKLSEAFKEVSGKSFQDFISEGNSLYDALNLIDDGIISVTSNEDDVAKKTEEYNTKIKELKEQLELAELQQSEFNESTKESTKLAKQMKIDDLTEEIEEYTGKLEDLIVTSETSETGFSDLFGSVEALQGALGLSGMNADSFNASLVAMEESAGSTESALDKLDGPAQTFKETLQTLTAIGLELADNLLPIVENIAGVIQNLADKFGNLNEKQQGALLILLAVLAALPAILTAMSALVLVVKGLAIAGSVLSLAFSPITLIVLAIAAAIAAVIAAGVLLVKNWDVIKAKAVEIGSKIGDVFQTVKENITSAFIIAFETVKKTLVTIANFIIKVFNGILSVISSYINIYIKGLNDIIDAANKVPGVDLNRIQEVDFKIPSIPGGLGSVDNSTTTNNNVSFNISGASSPTSTAAEINRQLGLVL